MKKVVTFHQLTTMKIKDNAVVLRLFIISPQSLNTTEGGKESLIKHNNGYLRLPNFKLHSFNDEPSIVWFGGQAWHFNGKCHRKDDKPAVVRSNSYKAWYINGEFHRDNDLPAVVRSNGDREWWFNGKRHRGGDKPAIVRSNGTKMWWLNGEVHRDDDKPAVMDINGTASWYINGKRIVKK